MTAHDPALVQRLAEAVWRAQAEAGSHTTSLNLAGTRVVLDLLAAEGRLCDPSEHLARLEVLGVELRQVRAERDWAIADAARLRSDVGDGA